MRGEFKVGDHVSWNSEAGRVRGTIRRKIKAPIKFKGYTVRASPEAPQYLIESDKTPHLAMHKGAALRRLGKPATRRATSRRRRGRSGKAPRGSSSAPFAIARKRPHSRLARREHAWRRSDA